MKTLFLRAVIVTFMLSISLSVPAQQSGNLDDAIKSLTNNIAKLEATTVPPSMLAIHRENINDQRIDLIALLGQKKGEVESYVNAVSANLLPAQRDKLSQQIDDLDKQIALQKKALKGEMQVDRTSTYSAAVEQCGGGACCRFGHTSELLSSLACPGQLQYSRTANLRSRGGNNRE